MIYTELVVFVIYLLFMLGIGVYFFIKSKEGGEKDVAKMDSTQITDVPTFSDPSSKKCYAYYYDVDNNWMLFYTSNGKNFDLISNDCQAINGVSFFEDSVG